jgi:hypothetical protein
MGETSDVNNVAEKGELYEDMDFTSVDNALERKPKKLDLKNIIRS